MSILRAFLRALGKPKNELISLINDQLVPREAIEDIPKKLHPDTTEPPILAVSDGSQHDPNRITLKIGFDATLGIHMNKRIKLNEGAYPFSFIREFIPEIGQFNLIDEFNRICPGCIERDRDRDIDDGTYQSIFVITNPSGLLEALQTNDNLANIRAKWTAALNQSQAELKKFQGEQKNDVTLSDMLIHYAAEAKKRGLEWEEKRKAVEAKLVSFPFNPPSGNSYLRRPDTYSLVELNAIIKSIEDFFTNSPLPQDKWGHYRLATCYATAASKSIERLAFDIDDKQGEQEARGMLMQAIKHMKEYYKNIEAAPVGANSEEYNWHQPEAAFYLGDFYQTLGMLAEGKEEREQHYKNAVKYYMETISNPYKVTQINDRYVRLCKDRIKMMGIPSNYNVKDETTLGQMFFDHPSDSFGKSENDMNYAVAVEARHNLGLPSLEVKKENKEVEVFVPKTASTPKDPSLAKLATLFPYSVDNIPDPSTYKLDDLLEIVNNIEKKSLQGRENVNDYQIATCYMALIGKIFEEILIPMIEKREFRSEEIKEIKMGEAGLTQHDILKSPLAVMTTILLKAKSHMTQFENDSYKRDPAEQAFFQTRSHIYLADNYSMLGLLSPNKGEKEKNYELALSYYANALDPPQSGAQYFDICQSGIRSIVADDKDMYEYVKTKLADYLYDHDLAVEQASKKDFPFSLEKYAGDIDYYQQKVAKVTAQQISSDVDKGPSQEGPSKRM